MFERRSVSLPLAVAAIVLAASAGVSAAAPGSADAQLAIDDLPELGEPVAAEPLPPTAAGRLGLDTPVARLCADPRARAVLDADLPGLTTRPEYAFFKHMSLKRLQAMSRGRMTDADLARVDAALQRISLAHDSFSDR